MLSHIKISNNIQINLDKSRLHALVGQNGSGKTFVLKKIANEFNGSYHALDPIALADVIQVIPWNSVKPVIQSNGQDLAIVLNYLREYARNNLKYLQESLTRVIPNVEKIKIIQFNRLDRDYVEVKLDTKSYKDIRAYATSKGTIFTLGFLTILLNPYQPKLILLDDLDHGFHPKAQKKLICVVKEILESNPDTQVIFSTHSPYTLDELVLSQVHVLTENVSGKIGCKRLDEHPDAEWAKQTLTTGEFWDSVGEGWVTEF